MLQFRIHIYWYVVYVYALSFINSLIFQIKRQRNINAYNEYNWSIPASKVHVEAVL
jgi:hypothetical protein